VRRLIARIGGIFEESMEVPSDVTPSLVFTGGVLAGFPSSLRLLHIGASGARVIEITCSRTRSRWAVPQLSAQRATVDNLPPPFALVLNFFGPELHTLLLFCCSSRSRINPIRNVFITGACREVITHCAYRCSCLPGPFSNNSGQFLAPRCR
jgi:hypothetical protein